MDEFNWKNSDSFNLYLEGPNEITSFLATVSSISCFQIFARMTSQK